MLQKLDAFAIVSLLTILGFTAAFIAMFIYAC